MTAPNMPLMPINGATATSGISLRCFGAGRLLLVMPKREQMGKPYEGKGTDLERQLVCDVVVLDGGPVRFGGKANNKGGMDAPDTMIVDDPRGWLVQNVVIFSKSMFFSLDAALPGPTNPHGSGVVGRLYQDAQYRNAWKLADSPTEAEVQLAQSWFANFAAGGHVNPVPRLIAAPPAQAAPQVAYGQAPTQPVYAPQPAAVPAYVGASTAPPQQAPAQVAYGPQGGWAQPVADPSTVAPSWPQQPAQAGYVPAPGDPAGWQQPQPGYAPQQPTQAPTVGWAPPQPAQAAPVADVPVPGYEAVWAGLPQPQKDALRQMFATPQPTH